MTGDLSAPEGDPTDKATWRRWFLERRRALCDTLTSSQRTEMNDALRRAALTWLTSRHQVGPGLTVTAYDQFGTEPPIRGLSDELRERGVRVLLPITRPDRLDWTAEPPGHSGEPAVHGPTELAAADVAFVPALAADQRGVRLGRGAGYYDQALLHRRPGVPVIAVLYAHELVDRLPAAAHDVPVDAVLTPQGVIELPRA